MTSAQYTWWKRTVDGYRAFAQHFRERGWLDRLHDYSADEPPYGSQWSDIPARRALVKAADPGLRVLVTTNIDLATQHGVAGDIDIMVPIVNHMDSTSAPFRRWRASSPFRAVGAGRRMRWTGAALSSTLENRGQARPLFVPGVSSFRAQA